MRGTRTQVPPSCKGACRSKSVLACPALMPAESRPAQPAVVRPRILPSYPPSPPLFIPPHRWPKLPTTVRKRAARSPVGFCQRRRDRQQPATTPSGRVGQRESQRKKPKVSTQGMSPCARPSGHTLWVGWGDRTPSCISICTTRGSLHSSTMAAMGHHALSRPAGMCPNSHASPRRDASAQGAGKTLHVPSEARSWPRTRAPPHRLRRWRALMVLDCLAIPSCTWARPPVLGRWQQTTTDTRTRPREATWVVVSWPGIVRPTATQRRGWAQESYAEVARWLGPKLNVCCRHAALLWPKTCVCGAILLPRDVQGGNPRQVQSCYTTTTE